MPETDFTSLVCENGCGSPTYGYAVNKWIYDKSKFEMRVVADGCGCIQSKEYSDNLMNGNVLFPVYNGVDFVYPEDDEYWETVHYVEGHEQLISIKGLPRTEIVKHSGKLYS